MHSALHMSHFCVQWRLMIGIKLFAFLPIMSCLGNVHLSTM